MEDRAFRVIFFWILLNRTSFGAHVFLVGDNPTSARLMGVNVVRVKTRAFMLVGVMAVFARADDVLRRGSLLANYGRRLPAE